MMSTLAAAIASSAHNLASSRASFDSSAATAAYAATSSN